MATTEEFSKTMEIPIDRFNELQAKFVELVKLDLDYPDLIKQLLSICTLDREFILVGICLGRLMQMGMCNQCEENEMPIDPKLN